MGKTLGHKEIGVANGLKALVSILLIFEVDCLFKFETKMYFEVNVISYLTVLIVIRQNMIPCSLLSIIT